MHNFARLFRPLKSLVTKNFQWQDSMEVGRSIVSGLTESFYSLHLWESIV